MNGLASLVTKKETTKKIYVWNQKDDVYNEQTLKSVDPLKVAGWKDSYSAWQNQEKTRIEDEMQQMRDTGVSEDTVQRVYADDLEKIETRAQQCAKMTRPEPPARRPTWDVIPIEKGKPPPPENIKYLPHPKWNRDKITDWLRAKGHGKHCQTFYKNKVDGAKFLVLTDENLLAGTLYLGSKKQEGLEVKKKPDRDALLALIAEVNQETRFRRTVRTLQGDYEKTGDDVPTNKWTTQDVTHWMECKGFGEFVMTFKEWEVNGKKLLAMTYDSMVNEMDEDITNDKDRTQILAAIEQAKHEIDRRRRRERYKRAALSSAVESYGGGEITKEEYGVVVGHKKAKPRSKMFLKFRAAAKMTLLGVKMQKQFSRANPALALYRLRSSDQETELCGDEDNVDAMDRRNQRRGAIFLKMRADFDYRLMKAQMKANEVDVLSEIEQEIADKARKEKAKKEQAALKIAAAKKKADKAAGLDKKQGNFANLQNVGKQWLKFTAKKRDAKEEVRSIESLAW